MAKPSETLIRKQNDSWVLIHNNQPYRINGAGGYQYLDKLKQAGGNSIRTWGISDKTQAILDDALANNITVTLGLWLGHERHGFNYSDPSQIKKQLDEVRQAVQQFKDHPALLMWGVGNEMEGDGSNPIVFKAVNDVAKLVKQLDPNHPTMTVIAELGSEASKVKSLNKFCPDIDIIGINTYGGVYNALDRYKQAGGARPVVVTEHGPLGHWESPKTKWGAPLEPTSTEKTKFYREGYTNAVLNHPETTLGSYAFLWGQKQETTATWYGMFLPDGTRLAAVDTMTKLWTGKPPTNACPEIIELKITSDHIVEPNDYISAELNAIDPDNDPLDIQWILRAADGKTGWGGDAEERNTAFNDVIETSTDKSVRIKMPEKQGPYRLFAYVRDNKGNGAVGNIPIFVRVQQAMNETQPAPIPFRIYTDTQPDMPYQPSGYMGNHSQVQMNEASNQNQNSGATCIEIKYNDPGQWAGVVWQHPYNDWGDKPGGYSLTGAKKLTWYARGAKGGEKIKFGFGLLGMDKTYHDTASFESEYTLTDQWMQYSTDLTGKDLSRIKTGFYWVLAGQGAPITFYLDDIKYE
ncbi:glycoside hydrolase family 2 TIM barrel-domain containing protein [Poriferisphaera corsica]|nr:glycoside hydrolase family 2 TIM barrel-domain containing protein [Poriferisphaera corsica]